MSIGDTYCIGFQHFRNFFRKSHVQLLLFPVISRYFTTSNNTYKQGTTMTKKAKSGHVRSTATLDLGKSRKDRISRFRAKKQLDGTPVTTLNEAVNQLLDKALELEQV